MGFLNLYSVGAIPLKQKRENDKKNFEILNMMVSAPGT